MNTSVAPRLAYHIRAAVLLEPVLAGGLASAKKFQQLSRCLAYGFQGSAVELKAELDPAQ
jgi:hypothetical protein